MVANFLFWLLEALGAASITRGFFGVTGFSWATGVFRATGVGATLGARTSCGGTAGASAGTGAAGEASAAGRFNRSTGQPVPGSRGALASGKLIIILGFEKLTASLGRTTG